MKEAGLLTDQTLRRPAASAVGLQVGLQINRFTCLRLALGSAANQSNAAQPAASAVGLRFGEPHA